MVPFDVSTEAIQHLPASDGVELAYRLVHADGGGPRGTIVHLHGIQSHGAWYVETAAELARRGYSVYLTDRRGSGRSGGPRGHFPSPAQLVDDVRRFVDLARSEGEGASSFVVGGGWGARAAIAHALEEDGLSGLALVCPALFAKVSLPPADRLRAIAGRALDPVQPIRIPLADEMFTSNPPYLEFIKSDPLSLREVTAPVPLPAGASGTGGSARTTGLRLPVLVLQSGHDPIVDAGTVRAWFDRLDARDKRYVLYPEWGHLLDFEEERQRYWNDLADWLDTVSTRQRP